MTKQERIKEISNQIILTWTGRPSKEQIAKMEALRTERDRLHNEVAYG